MRTIGSRNKQKTEPCYKGPSMSYDAFVTLYIKIRQPTEEEMYKKYQRFLEDIKKTKFRTYRKTNYDLLVKTGLHIRKKSKYKL